MRRFFLEKKIIKFHKFCVEPVTSLPKDIQNKLIDYFTTQESKLLRGFPRSILIDIGIEEAWFEPIDKWLIAFCKNSGFNRSKSQRNSNMNLIEFLSYFEEISRKFPEKSLDEILEIFKTKAEVKLPEAFKRGEKWLRRLEEKKINNQIRKAEEIGKSDIQVMNSDEELVKLNLQETSITDRIKRGDIINDAEELKVVKLRIEELEKRLS